MRRILPLLILLALLGGCKKKRAAAPRVDVETGAAEEVEGGNEAEPSEREELLAMLKSGNVKKRREAADSLAALAETDETTRESLLALLRDKSTAGAGKTHPTQIRSTREAAAVALMQAGPKGEALLTEKGLPALREGLFDKDPAVREHTARTLEVIGLAAKPLSKTLLRVCAEDKDPQVRAIAFDALRSVGVADVPALAALLNNKESEIRRRAAEVICVLPEIPPAAVRSLARALEDDDAVIREAAAMAIETAGPKGATKEAAANLVAAIKKSFPPIHDPKEYRPDDPRYVYFTALSRQGKPAVEPILALLKQKNTFVQVLALRTLGDIGPDAIEASKAVRDYLADNATVSLEAVVTLCRIGEKDLEQALKLVPLALTSADPLLVEAGIDTVARMGPPGRKFIPDVLKHLTADSPNVRYAAVGFVGTLEPPEAAKQVAALAKLAADPEPLIRQRVGAVLQKLGPVAAPAAKAIGQALAQETDEGAKEQYVDTLMAMGKETKEAVIGLAPLVSDPGSTLTLRIKVIGAIVAADPASTATAAALIKAASDRDQHIRKAAALALGKLNPLSEEARATLVKLLRSDRRADVMAAAAHGLAVAGPRAKAAKPDLEAVAAGKLPATVLWAKVALAAIDGNKTKAGEIVREALAGRNNSARIAAAEALLVVGPLPEDLPTLLKISRVPVSNAKEASARALGRLGATGKDAVPRLIELLGDRDGDVRGAAVEALGEIGLPAAAPAIPKLKEALRSDPTQAASVKKALEKLGVNTEEKKQ